MDGRGVGGAGGGDVAAFAVCVVAPLGEPLMMIPGVDALYPVLPGGATAALTDFTYLADAMAQEVGGTAVQLLPPVAGALLLSVYALAAALIAVVLPMRRDIT